jgi:signal transduction histidine kinase
MIVVYEDLEYFVRNRSHKSNAKVINLSQFAKERREFFNDLLVAKNIKIECSIQENVYIKISPLELSRIIDNTLSNAIKYSKSGTKIKLRVFKYKTKVYLYIKDEGRGIKDTQKIFDRYYRDDKISGGFGIGLNIVKKICKKNSIEIKVCSKVGRGSKFVYIFNKS